MIKIIIGYQNVVGLHVIRWKNVETYHVLVTNV
jgi:hypothetical protein